MVETRGGLGLAQQAHPRLGIGQLVGGDEFDGDVAIERRVVGTEHLAHPTTPEQLVELVPAELACAGDVGHAEV